MALLVLVLALVAAAATMLVRGDSGPWVAPPDAKNQKNPVPVNDSSIAAGKEIYGSKCVDCHGEKGDGQGQDAMNYSPAPTDFTDPKTIQDETDGELFWKITTGRRPMPSYKNKLNDEERWEVINYIRTFQKSQPKSSSEKK